MQQEDFYMPGRVVVQFKEGVVPVTGHAKTGLNSFDAVASPFGIYRVQQAFPVIEAAAAKRALLPAARKLRRMYYVEYSGPFDPWEVVSGLLRSKEVERAEPHFTYELAGNMSKAAIRDHNPAGRVVPDDELYDDQTHLNGMEMEAAWDVVKGEDGNVVVAITDGGTYWRHQDLRDNVWVNADEIPGNGIDDDNNGYVDDVHGWDFSDSTNDPTGADGHVGLDHATSVTGVVAAVANNGIGIAGTSWNAKFMPVNSSCLLDAGLCWSAAATVYAAENGADVITAAYGRAVDSFLLADAMEFAVEHGAVVVAAGGNHNHNIDDMPLYPASYPTTLSVGGTRKNSDRTSQHVFGRSLDVVAAAKDVNTTILGNQYDVADGTSLSVPIVAGVAALVRTQWPDYGVYEVMEQIRQTADNIDEAQPISRRGLMGRGRVNARRAVTEEATPGIRMVKFDWKDADGNGDLVPGESFTVEADFVNYGGDARALSVGLGVGNSRPFVTVTSPMIAVGAVPRLGTFSASFDLQVNDPSPENHTMVLYVTVEDGDFSSVSDHLRIMANIKGLRSVTTSKLTASVTNQGNIGYLINQEAPGTGEGFTFLGKQTRLLSAMYEGGLLIGTGVDNLVDCLASDRPDKSRNKHFKAVPGADLFPQKGGPTTGWLRVEMEDSGAEYPLGLHILQDSFVDDTPEHEDFLVLRYAVTNTNEDQWLRGMYIGVYIDWDLDPDEAIDSGVYNEENQVAMIFDSEFEFGGTGVKVLSSPPGISFDLLPYQVTFSGGFSNSEKWEALSGGISNSVNYARRDLAQMVGAGPFDLGPQETTVVGFALIGGHDESDIVESAVNAQALWDSKLSGNTVANEAGVTPAQFDFAPVYPNPGNGMYSLSFTLPDAADVELVIYNALSQEVRALLHEPRSAGVHTVEWNGIDDAGASVASGVYFARLVAQGVKGRMTRSRPLVVIR